jgi:hypothetical protein
VTLAAGIVLFAVTALTGCTQQSPAIPTPSASPLAALTFDDGDRLDPAQQVSWVDPFAGADGYTVLTENDGDGSWSYTSDDTGCVIGYYEGTLKDLDASAGDSALSDELLAAQFGSTAEDIAGFAKDGVAPFRTPTQLVETRGVAGTDSASGTTYIVAARGFAALGTGFVASLECPAEMDVASEWATLNTDSGAFALVFAASEG